MLEEVFVNLASLIFIHAVSTLSPGPSTLYLLNVGIKYSKNNLMRASFGVALSEGVYIILGACGVGIIITQYRELYRILQIAGGLYLAHIAYQCFKSFYLVAFKKESIALQTSASRKNFLLGGALVSILNVKTLIFYIILFSEVVKPSSYFVSIFYGFIILILNGIYYFIIAQIFGNNTMREKLINKMHIMDILAGVVMLGFAIKLFIPG